MVLWIDYINSLFPGQTLSEKTINQPNMRHFWETVTTSVTVRESGGHVDIFIPLVETGNWRGGEGRKDDGRGRSRDKYSRPY